MNKKPGFSFVELMVAVAIIALLSLIAIPKYWRFHAKAKRAEVYLNLSSLHTAEKLYWAENGRYTNNISQLGWAIDGQPNYSYGFSGSQNTNYILGKLGGDVSAINSHANAGESAFVAVAVADIDGDGKPDVITINENREVKIVEDDLQ